LVIGHSPVKFTETSEACGGMFSISTGGLIMNTGLQKMTARQVEAYSGRHEQLFGIRQAELTEGRERGVRIAEVNNGGGLRFTVLLDRGLDIGNAAFKDTNLAFLTTGDFAHPSYFADRGIEWLRNWGGGLVTGCGLRNVGSPGEADGETFSLHGRLSNIPAREVVCREVWQKEGCVLTVEGKMAERRIFGENLQLARRISTPVGGDWIQIEDTMTNQGFQPEPAFLLFHVNWGFPIIHEKSVLEAVPHKVEPRDDTAATGLKDWSRMQPPTQGYAEQCFYHDIPAGRDGFSRMSIKSPKAGLKVEVAYRKKELPNLIQWKMMGQGAYVTGLEPANCRVGGRAAELKRKPHCILKGGESVTFVVRLGISTL